MGMRGDSVHLETFWGGILSGVTFSGGIMSGGDYVRIISGDAPSWGADRHCAIQKQKNKNKSAIKRSH